MIRLYHQQKNYSKAASIYQRLCKQLAEELGITPLRETTELYYSIMDEWNRSASEVAAFRAEDFIGRHFLDYLFSASNEAGPRHISGSDLLHPDDPEQMLRFYTSSLSENALQILDLIAMFQECAPYDMVS